MTTADTEFEQLYRRYFGRLHRHFRGMRFEDDAALDLAQETFKRIYERIEQYRGDAAWTFIEATARNLAYNAIRTSNTKKRSVNAESLDSLPEAPDVSANPFTGEEPSSQESAFINNEQAELQRLRLRAAIAGLPDGARECLALWARGFKYGEIAQILHISTDAVKSRLRDAKRFIREKMDPSA